MLLSPCCCNNAYFLFLSSSNCCPLNLTYWWCERCCCDKWHKQWSHSHLQCSACHSVSGDSQMTVDCISADPSFLKKRSEGERPYWGWGLTLLSSYFTNLLWRVSIPLYEEGIPEFMVKYLLFFNCSKYHILTYQSKVAEALLLRA